MSCVWMLQRGHSGDGCVLASTLCKYDLRKGDLFVLSWARVRLYEVPLSCVFVGFWDRDYVSQLPCVRYYVFVKNSFKHTREECESKRAYVF